MPQTIELHGASKMLGCPIHGAASSRHGWESKLFPRQLLPLLCSCLCPYVCPQRFVCHAAGICLSSRRDLLLFLLLFVFASATSTNVISTEGGALCRRSGEIPVFAFALAVVCSLSKPAASHRGEREGGTPSRMPTKRCAERLHRYPEGSLFFLIGDFPNKNPCQAPKPPNSSPINKIRVA